MGIFTLVFGHIAKLPSFNIPYPLLVFSGFISWMFFGNMLTECTDSLLTDAGIISKIYFPRILIPASRVMIGLIDLVIAILTFYLMSFLFHFPCHFKILPLLVLISILVLLSLGLGYFFSALNIRYRDFRYIVGFGLQLLFYISPIGYSRGIIPETWRSFYDLNPMVGIIEGFRWAMLGNQYPLPLASVMFSIAIAMSVFILGVRYFLSKENDFTDYI